MTPAEKLAAARQSAAVGPVLERGLLRVSGRDRLSYLHRMSTQHLTDLKPGQSAYAAFLTAKGHLVGEGMVLVRDEEILVDVDPAALADTRNHLAKFVIMDDVSLDDASAALRVLPVFGPEGAALVRGREAPKVETSRRGAPCVDLYLPPDAAASLRQALVSQGAAALDEQDLEVLRVEAGIPRFGLDMDGARLPMEAGLTRAAIHFNKGCYIGQEIVLRATVRGHLQKGLVQLQLPAGAARGAPLRSGGEVVGQVTSAVDAPSGRIGLGYAKRAHWHPGARLSTDGGEAEVRKVIVEEGTA